MPITTRDEDLLSSLVELHHHQAGTKRREDFFPLMYLPKKFGIGVEEVIPCTAFGNNDYGIDAYYIDRAGKNLFLYQFKWSENPHLFKESLERLATAGMERIFGNAINDPNRNDLLRSLRADLDEVRSLIERVYIHFVFKGDADKAESSPGLQDRKEQLENKAHFAELFFGRAVPVLVEFISDRRSGGAIKPADSHTLAFGNPLICDIPPDGPRMLVGRVRLIDLHAIYRQLGPRFFDRNIRAGLSSDNPPNRKIRQALESIVLKGQLAPEWFSFHHNGVTLAAERASVVDGQLTMKVPRLLNGAQTVSSIVKFIDDNSHHPAVKNENGQGSLSRIQVLAKIIISDPFGDTVTRITISNNQQNPVHPWNLRANDRIQSDLEDKFKEDVRVPYERQENAFKELTEDQMDDYDHDQPIKIRPLAQTFCAMQGDVATMDRVRGIFEEQKHYEAVFHRRYLACDARKIILSYKVGTCMPIVLRHMDGLVPQWIKLAVKKSRYIVWALLVQALFNDRHLDEYLETWGKTLKREQDFREYLCSVSANRILPIMKEAYADPAIKDKISRDLFVFTKSKDMFRRCMQIAEDKFKWERRTV